MSQKATGGSTAELQAKHAARQGTDIDCNRACSLDCSRDYSSRAEAAEKALEEAQTHARDQAEKFDQAHTAAQADARRYKEYLDARAKQVATLGADSMLYLTKKLVHLALTLEQDTVAEDTAYPSFYTA